MEDVLDLYAEPYDRQRPVVCFDERPCQLLADVRLALPMACGQPKRYDYEYERRGSCNLFMAFQPLAAWRRTEVTAQRTRLDFAEQMRKLVDEDFPEADRTRVVLDNLSTHSPAALYAAFPPEEARRLVRKLEFHYTPTHGSWLNRVEIEWAVLVKQCFNRRMGEMGTLQREACAWARQRNAQAATVKWLFNVTAARTKLARSYP